MNNITYCRSCGVAIIEEELSSHQCKRVKDYKIANDILWVSDGDKWYPIRLSNVRLHMKESDDKVTEPATAKFKKPL